MSDEKWLSAGQAVPSASLSETKWNTHTPDGRESDSTDVYNCSSERTPSIRSPSPNKLAETAAETAVHGVPQLALDVGSEQAQNCASSASPVPSITISGPASPEEEEMPRPPLFRITSVRASSSGGLHPRRSRSLSAGAQVGGGSSMDMKAMEASCEVPEHRKAVNTIRDLKSEIEELKERVEQGEKREDGFLKLVDEQRELQRRIDESQAEVQELQTKSDKFKRERDDYLRAKNRLNRELQERNKAKAKPCHVAEHEELSRRVREMEADRDKMKNSRECSMPLHHQFLAEYAERVKEQDREIQVWRLRTARLQAMEICNLPLHKIILKEYHDQVNIMDKEIQAKDKVIEEQERMIATATSVQQESGVSRDHSAQLSQTKAMEDHLEGQRAKLGQDLQSVIDEMKRQEKDMDGWIANIAQRDVYTREITDEDLERLHKIYLDRSNGFRALKKEMASGQSEEPRKQERGDQDNKTRRLENWVKKKEAVVSKAVDMVERLQMELKERDVEIIALRKGAKISIDQSKMDPDHFDLKWELDNDKYRGLIKFGVQLKLVDQQEALQKLQQVEIPNARADLKAFKKANEKKRLEVEDKMMRLAGEAPKEGEGLR